MPVFMHGSPILLALGIAPLLVMVCWLIRVRLTDWFRRNAVAS
jgi:flagellar biosynthesis protein FliR